MNEPQPPNNLIPPEPKPKKRKSLWRDEPEAITISELNADIEVLRIAVNGTTKALQRFASVLSVDKE